MLANRGLLLGMCLCRRTLQGPKPGNTADWRGSPRLWSGQAGLLSRFSRNRKILMCVIHYYLEFWGSHARESQCNLVCHMDCLRESSIS